MIIIPKARLMLLKANAVAASKDKDLGDRWNVNHGYVVSKDYTICHPTHDSANALSGFPPNDRSMGTRHYANHMAGADPYTIMALVDEVVRLRQEVEGSGPAITEEREEALALLVSRFKERPFSYVWHEDLSASEAKMFQELFFLGYLDVGSRYNEDPNPSYTPSYKGRMYMKGLQVPGDKVGSSHSQPVENHDAEVKEG